MIAAGFGIGFVVAAQVGPVTLLVVRTVLRGGRAVLVGLVFFGGLLGYRALRDA